MKLIFLNRKFVIFSFCVITLWILGSYSILSNQGKIREAHVTRKKIERNWIDREKIKEREEELQIKYQNIVNKRKGGPGEMGKPVILPDNPTAETRHIIAEGWRLHNFNQYASDLVSVHRSLPDPRDEYCKEPYQFNIKLPRTSIIICFHNEAWSVLLRSIYSVLDRSPPHLIEEIILVDDFSDMEHLQKPLEDYWADDPKVKIIRTKKREGLMRARLRGTALAKGEILTFLDSHIEAAPGWLEPLLDRIDSNYTTVVCPVMDSIRYDNFEFLFGKDVYVGGFDWNLLPTWHAIPEREVKRRYHYSEAVRSPTMSSSIFSISKKFFEEIGTYDDEFETWGAANLELSFKTWMCGGTLEIVPCSHVGHIFGENFPKRSIGNSSSTDLRRLAEVWMDDYKQYHYLRRGEPDIPVGDISVRLELRKKLECQSFKWFLDNVYPEMFIPDKVRDYGFIKSNGLCIDSWARHQELLNSVSVSSCLSTNGSGGQFWYYTGKNEIRNEDSCLDFTPARENQVTLFPCHGNYGSQQWDYDTNFGLFSHPLSRKCLRANEEKLVEVAECDYYDSFQKWNIEFILFP